MAYEILETVLQKVTIVKPTVGTLLHGSLLKKYIWTVLGILNIARIN